MKLKIYIFLFTILIISFLTSCISREDFYELSFDILAPEMALEVPGELDVPGGGFTTEVFVPISDTLTVENEGEKDLQIKGLLMTGGDITQFELDRSGLVHTVKPGESTSFKVIFKPTKELGSDLELTLTSNDPDDDVFNLTIFGYAGPSTSGLTGPGANINLEGDDYPDDGSGSLDFGAVQTGQSSLPARFTIENTGDYDLTIYDLYISGTDWLDFNIEDSSTSGVIEPGGSTVFDVLFTPGSDGQKAAAVNLLSDDPDTEYYTFSVVGEGSGSPVQDINVRMEGENQELLSVSGTKTYDFGTVSMLSPRSLTFNIVNPGTDDLNVTDIASDMVDFDAGPAAFTVPVGESRTITLTFDPSAAGPAEATITITNDDPDEPVYYFNVTGTGDDSNLPYIEVLQEDNIILPGVTYDLGESIVFVPLIKEFTVGNTGASDLNIASITLEDSTDSYILYPGSGPFPLTISPGDPPYTFEITFEPLATGEAQADVIIENNIPYYSDDGFRITVSGTGLPELGPIIEVSPDPAALDLDTEVFVPSSGTLSIENTGDRDLRITGLVMTGGDITQFELDSSGLVYTVKPGESTSFKVIFKPTKELGSDVELTLTSNDPANDVILLTIAGYAGPSISGIAGPGANINLEGDDYPDDGSGSLYFGAVQTGQSSLPARFTIENTGDYDLTIYDLYISGTDRLDFNIDDSSTSGVIEPGGITVFDVFFTPGSDGQKEAAVNLLSDDPDTEYYTFSVHGEGSALSVPDINVRMAGETQDLLSVSGSKTYDFGTVSMLSPRSLTFNIMNVGTDVLNVLNIASDIVDFEPGPIPAFSVDVGESRPFTLTFNPSTAAFAEATITITSDDLDETPYYFNVNGTGDNSNQPVIEIFQESNIVLPESLYDIGKNIVGVPLIKEFTVGNTGNADLSIESIALEDLTGSYSLDLGLNPPPLTISPSDPPYTFEITFEPSKPGDLQADIIIKNDTIDYSNGFRFTVSGIGQPDLGPVIEVWQGTTLINDINRFDFNEIFGPIPAGGQSPPLGFEIKNTVTEPLIINSIGLKKGKPELFVVSIPEIPFSIGAGESNFFSVTFNPVDVTLERAEILINSNAVPDNRVTIDLSGTGTE